MAAKSHRLWQRVWTHHVYWQPSHTGCYSMSELTMSNGSQITPAVTACLNSPCLMAARSHRLWQRVWTHQVYWQPCHTGCYSMSELTRSNGSQITLAVTACLNSPCLLTAMSHWLLQHVWTVGCYSMSELLAVTACLNCWLLQHVWTVSCYSMSELSTDSRVRLAVGAGGWLTVRIRASRECMLSLSSSRSRALLEARPLSPAGLLAVSPAMASCSSMAGTATQTQHLSLTHFTCPRQHSQISHACSWRHTHKPHTPLWQHTQSHTPVCDNTPKSHTPVDDNIHTSLAHLSVTTHTNLTHLFMTTHANLTHLFMTTHPNLTHLFMTTHPNLTHLSVTTLPNLTYLSVTTHPNLTYLSMTTHPNSHTCSWQRTQTSHTCLWQHAQTSHTCLWQHTQTSHTCLCMHLWQHTQA